MPTRPRIPAPLGHARPEPKKPGDLPKKRCRNCNKPFPLTKVNRAFCRQECKNEFHNFGSAYGPLKARLEKMIVVEARRQSRLQARAQFNDYARRDLGRDLIAAGFVNRKRLRPQAPKATTAQLAETLTIIDLMLSEIAMLFTGAVTMAGAISRLRPTLWMQNELTELSTTNRLFSETVELVRTHAQDLRKGLGTNRPLSTPRGS